MNRTLEANEDVLGINETDGFEQPKENGSQALARIIEKATFDPNFDPNKLAVLFQVKKDYEADEARKAFEQAFQKFKRNLPTILKTKHVSFPTSGGGRTEYNHAELDKAAPIIQDALLSYGIDQSWESGTDASGKTTVTCILKGFHHTERAATLSGPPDTSGGKNGLQAIGSTASYLQRYTLFMACGIVPKGVDDDGRQAEGLPENSIVDYCIQMQDAADFQELKPIFGECWNKAKAINDKNAMERFRVVYEQRKKDFRQ